MNWSSILSRADRNIFQGDFHANFVFQRRKFQTTVSVWAWSWKRWIWWSHGWCAWPPWHALSTGSSGFTLTAGRMSTTSGSTVNLQISTQSAGVNWQAISFNPQHPSVSHLIPATGRFTISPCMFHPGMSLALEICAIMKTMYFHDEQGLPSIASAKLVYIWRVQPNA